MQYVGSRYVPKFMGSYDATQIYEVLCVVDNGLGTSYISKKPTPAGTPLTDTEYWAVYGASSGAIINLQNQIDNLASATVKTCDTLTALISTDAIAGEQYITLGYSTVNDKGDAKYYISATAPSTGHYETLDNGLYAVLIENGIVNLNAYGCLDGVDISSILQSVVNRVKLENIGEVHLYGVDCDCYTVINTSAMSSLNRRVTFDFHGSIIRGNSNNFMQGNVNTLHKNITIKNVTLKNFDVCFSGEWWVYGMTLENMETNDCNKFISMKNGHFLVLNNIRGENSGGFSGSSYIELDTCNLVRMTDCYGSEGYDYLIKLISCESVIMDSCDMGNPTSGKHEGVYIYLCKNIGISNSYFESSYNNAIRLHGTTTYIDIQNTFFNVPYAFTVTDGQFRSINFKSNYTLSPTKLFNTTNYNLFGSIEIMPEDMTGASTFDYDGYVSSNNIPEGVSVKLQGMIHGSGGYSDMYALTDVTKLHGLKNYGSYGSNYNATLTGIYTKDIPDNSFTHKSMIDYKQSEVIYVCFEWFDSNAQYKKRGFVIDSTFYTIDSASTTRGTLTITNDGGKVSFKAKGDYSNLEPYVSCIYYNLIA